MSEGGSSSEDRFTDRIWPPVFRKGHRMEKAEDLLAPECEYELLADCEKCPPETARHKTHLDATDFKTLNTGYGNHWLVGFYIEKGWNVERGICQPCLDAIPVAKKPVIVLPTRENRRLIRELAGRRN